LNNLLIKEIVSEIRGVVSDKQRKPIHRIIYELLSYLIINRDFPKYYSRNLLHRRDILNYLDYYCGKNEFYKIRTRVKDLQLMPFLENKVLFHYHFLGSGIRLPIHLGYNIGTKYFTSDGSRAIPDLVSFSSLVQQQISMTRSGSVFIKPIDGFGGRDCFRVDAGMLGSDYVADSYKKISTSKYLFQETIVQHPRIKEVYANSINTLRIHSCTYKSGQTDLISAYMRFGSRGSFVEGGGLGTIFIHIDMNTGKLGTFAYKNFEYGGDKFTRHPDTGYEFSGFQIPHFKEVLDMARAAAAILPYRLVGWDIAVSETGPVLLEGNINFGFWGAQIADSGFKKNKVFRTFFEELENK